MFLHFLTLLNTSYIFTVKVWPFFQKEHNQQTKELPVDEEKLKAKLMFLESGVPDVLKRRVQADKRYIELNRLSITVFSNDFMLALFNYRRKTKFSNLSS